jgi:hypothetical protein
MFRHEFQTTELLYRRRFDGIVTKGGDGFSLILFPVPFTLPQQVRIQKHGINMQERAAPAHNQPCTKADRTNIQAAIKILFEPRQVVELRAPKAGKHGTVSGYFDDHAKLARELEELSGEVRAVYYTLNPVNPALLARASNRIKTRAEHLTNDSPDNVVHRNWLLIDCDPVRPANISSTDEEKKAAKQLASEVRNHLRSLGWPEPVACDSGNGYHLLCRVGLPNDAESHSLLESVLKALAARFDTSAIKIDQKVFNASRITKAYGTQACKGDSIPERPHRVSRMFAPPERIEPVAKELLLAAEEPRPEKKKSPQPVTANGTSLKNRGGWTPELVEEVLDKAGVNWGPAMDYNGSAKWQHDCLSNPDHKKPDAFTILDADGYAHHHCSHNSCADLTDADWRKLWEERTGEAYPWPGRRKAQSGEAGVSGVDTSPENSHKDEV